MHLPHLVNADQIAIVPVARIQRLRVDPPSRSAVPLGLHVLRRGFRGDRTTSFEQRLDLAEDEGVPLERG
jgi:hypothetical protein